MWRPRAAWTTWRRRAARPMRPGSPSPTCSPRRSGGATRASAELFRFGALAAGRGVPTLRAHDRGPLLPFAAPAVGGGAADLDREIGRARLARRRPGDLRGALRRARRPSLDLRRREFFGPW